MTLSNACGYGKRQTPKVLFKISQWECTELHSASRSSNAHTQGKQSEVGYSSSGHRLQATLPTAQCKKGKWIIPARLRNFAKQFVHKMASTIATVMLFFINDSRTNAPRPSSRFLHPDSLMLAGEVSPPI
jgi:hypothetical protein